MKNVLIIFGTRPEAIKMAPVVHAFQESKTLNPIVVSTGQHGSLLEQALNIFDMKIDHDLKIMTQGQTLSQVTQKVLRGVDEVIQKTHPELILVHGDTTTSFAAALAGYYSCIPIGHVEAGLRTFDRTQPFPEELNRTFCDYMTTLHFAPTEKARENLLGEKGFPKDHVYVTGNTVIDALKYTLAKGTSLDSYPETNDILANKRPYVLITCHRRENFGQPVQQIFRAIQMLAEKFENFDFVYPVHPNPNVKDIARELLSQQKNIKLIAPQDYLPFVKLMENCHFIMSDSGGIQEEAPAIDKPVLVLREVSERPEAIEAGVAHLVGNDQSQIVRMASQLIEDKDYYDSIASKGNPFGDGTASLAIRDHCESFLS